MPWLPKHGMVVAIMELMTFDYVGSMSLILVRFEIYHMRIMQQ